ncbi:phosphatidylglycerophosphate synthase [Plasmodium sp. gorilla clade G2]|uniref:phosphatidylglycerophosphate synthase n=1 Tax=Plasmodium sp. gorilla clade G2 TaxID=880535 RepID=UPI000D222105|nr:phosphatidylglycerophosphate synthase [Plasmodium sp. gorilla clade G2]SOV13731.1 phosphatidylglycerophosphate synthase [Plasmodium sp. gorilla clade G2]
MALKFVIHEPKAKLLFTPNEFFNTLNDIFKNSQNRIVISCLYMGIGELEKELIHSIQKNVNIKDLKVDILLDRQRGTRPEGKLNESSVSILSELFKCSDNINISLFHNPLLGPILYNILPPRANEAIGVMHMKIYIGDNTLVLSGANLSDCYLRNRQDRYFVIENKFLADSIHNIINTIQDMSFTLNSDLSIQWENDLINPLIDAYVFREQYYRRIRFMLKQIQKNISQYNKNYSYNNSYNNIKNNSINDNIYIYNNKCSNTLNEFSMLNSSSTDICEKDTYNNKNQKKNDKKYNMETHSFYDTDDVVNDSTVTLLNNNQNENQTNNLFTHINEKNEFFYPLYETNKSILILELSLQCGFSIPPIYDETDMLESLLKNIEKYDQSLVISSGYLNFPMNFLKLIRNIYINLIQKKNGILQLITASPCANSFYKSKGISYYIPSSYSAMANVCIEYITKNVTNFLKKVNGQHISQENHTSNQKIYIEYYKPSWTFHSKGIWIMDNMKNRKKIKNIKNMSNVNDNNNDNNNNNNKLDSYKKYEQNHNNSPNVKTNLNKSGYFNNENFDNDIDEENENILKYENINDINESDEHYDNLPWCTVIGSSNYGYRAKYRDLEMSFIIKTNDYNLRCQLKNELNIIYESSHFVQMDELKLRYAFWLKFLVKYIFKWLL